MEMRIDQLREQVARLEAENKKLREALWLMMDWANEVSDEKIDGAELRQEFAKDMAEARAALKVTP